MLPTPWKDKNAPKTARRRPTKHKIQQKLLVVGRRNAENDKNCLSSADETQNHPKTAFPPGRKIKIAQKLRFRHGGKSKSLENCVSARAEKQNHSKTSLPPRRKNKIGENRNLFTPSPHKVLISGKACNALMIRQGRGSPLCLVHYSPMRQQILFRPIRQKRNREPRIESER